MSLINKMLTDLETRKDLPAAAKPAKPIFADLRPAARVRGRSRRALVNIVVLVGFAGAGVYAWHTWGAAWVNGFDALKNMLARPDTGKTHSVPVVEVAVAPQPVATVPAAPAVTQAQKPKAPEAKPVESKPAPRVVPKVMPAAQKPARIVVPAGDKTAMVEKTDRPWTPQEQAENRYRKAVGHLKQKQRREAEIELQAALTADPRHSASRELLVGILLESNRTPAAQKLLEQGLTAVPGHVTFAQLLARLYVEHGAEAQALTLLEQHRAGAAQNAEYMALLATLYQRAGRHADSVGAYRQALSLRPQEGKWWVGLGISLEADKHWQAAYEAYTHAQTVGVPPALSRYIEQRLAALKGRAG